MNGKEGIEFIEHVGFGHLHIFTYSPREGTKAATLPNPVSEPIKKQRSQQLHKLGDQMRLNFYQTNLGKQFPILWEGYSESVTPDTQRIFGYTPNYLKVACVVSKATSLANTMTTVNLQTIGDNFILAE